MTRLLWAWWACRQHSQLFRNRTCITTTPVRTSRRARTARHIEGMPEDMILVRGRRVRVRVSHRAQSTNRSSWTVVGIRRWRNFLYSLTYCHRMRKVPSTGGNTSLDISIQLSHDENVYGGLTGESKTNTIKRVPMSHPRSMGLEADMIILARVLLGMQVS